jgi:hypothetical protein
MVLLVRRAVATIRGSQPRKDVCEDAVGRHWSAAHTGKMRRGVCVGGGVKLMRCLTRALGNPWV